MNVSVPYCNSKLEVELPEDYLMGIAIANNVQDSSNEADELEKAFTSPIGTKKLSELAYSKQKVAIIISDNTRPTPSAKILPVILKELTEAGIEYGNITVISASGTHVPNTPEELKVMVGEDVWNKVKVIAHDCEKQDDLVYIGNTKRGTPLSINKNVAAADLKISVGCIEPHHNAGWSGGAKNLLPGVSSKETVFTHHAFATHNGVDLGALEGNPFREDLDDAARLAGVDYIINCYLDSKGRIKKAFGGDLIEAHRAGIDYITSLISYPIPCRANIVIASPGGAPRDKNFWQSEGKCLTRINSAVKDEGIVILVADCADGIGHVEFEKALDQTVDEILERFANEKFSVMGNKAFRLAKLLKRVNLFIVSDKLEKSSLSKLPIKCFLSLQEALDFAIQTLNEDPSILVVPYATQVLIKVTNN